MTSKHQSQKLRMKAGRRDQGNDRFVPWDVRANAERTSARLDNNAVHRCVHCRDESVEGGRVIRESGRTKASWTSSTCFYSTANRSQGASRTSADTRHATEGRGGLSARGRVAWREMKARREVKARREMKTKVGGLKGERKGSRGRRPRR